MEAVQRLEWDEYFMGIACVAANRSMHPTFLNGACIVHKGNRVLGIGYYGMPRRFEVSDLSPESKYSDYFCDAITNALCYAKEDVEGARIYSTVFPSHEYVKHMIQKGIVEVISPKTKFQLKQETKDMITYEEIEGHPTPQIYCREFTPSKSEINIDFKELNNERYNQLQ